MTIMTSAGKMSAELAKILYSNANQLVTLMVKNKVIKPSQKEATWAAMVAKDLAKYGYDIPKKIAALLK